MVHPGRITDPSLAAGLLFKYGPSGLSWAGGMDRPGIVHRLDKDTTGLMVIAKNDAVHAHLKVCRRGEGKGEVEGKAEVRVGLTWF